MILGDFGNLAQDIRYQFFKETGLTLSAGVSLYENNLAPPIQLKLFE